MILSIIDISNVPQFVITALITFAGTFSVVKFEIKAIRKKNDNQTMEIEKLKASHIENKDMFFQQRERDQRIINEKFQHTDLKREELKDTLTTQMHCMDKKITEIHTIIVTKNKS